MDDMPFGLARQTTYAKLSPQDLESMGKQAAVAYLSKSEPSLNEAITKLAKCHPSISPHQVRRVVEFANQEAFSRLFADNEKYASDKNIEFPVADPGAILHDLNDGARPQMIAAPADEYHTGPVKTAASTSAVEADLALTKLFTGVDLVSPNAEKTAMAPPNANRDIYPAAMDRIFAAGSTPVHMDKTAGAVADKILLAGEEEAREDKATLETGSPHGDAKQSTYDEDAQKEAMGGPESVMQNAQPQQHPEVTHRENMRGMERRVELEKKKQELVAMQAKGMETPGDMGGAPGGAPPAGGPPAGPAPMAAGPGAGPGANAPAPAAPPAPGAPQQKLGSDMTKQALAYAKMGRPKAAAVLDDLRQATSLDNIKVASRAAGGSYPDANPHGDLVRSKQKVARLLEDARAAKDTNEELQKEATARLQRAVLHHMHDRGDMGEVTHLMGHINGNEVLMKTAMSAVVTELKRHGFDPVKLQAQSIQYEMTKSAHFRTPNPDHPICQAFSDFCKLADGQMVLNLSHSSLKAKHAELEGVLKQAMTQHAVAV